MNETVYERELNGLLISLSNSCVRLKSIVNNPSSTDEEKKKQTEEARKYIDGFMLYMSYEDIIEKYINNPSDSNNISAKNAIETGMNSTEKTKMDDYINKNKSVPNPVGRVFEQETNTCLADFTTEYNTATNPNTSDVDRKNAYDNIVKISEKIRTYLAIEKAIKALIYDPNNLANIQSLERYKNSLDPNDQQKLDAFIAVNNIPQPSSPTQQPNQPNGPSNNPNRNSPNPLLNISRVTPLLEETKKIIIDNYPNSKIQQHLHRDIAQIQSKYANDPVTMNREIDKIVEKRRLEVIEEITKQGRKIGKLIHKYYKSELARISGLSDLQKANQAKADLDREMIQAISEVDAFAESLTDPGIEYEPGKVINDSRVKDAFLLGFEFPYDKDKAKNDEYDKDVSRYKGATPQVTPNQDSIDDKLREAKKAIDEDRLDDAENLLNEAVVLFNGLSDAEKQQKEPILRSLMDELAQKRMVQVDDLLDQAEQAIDNDDLNNAENLLNQAEPLIQKIPANERAARNQRLQDLKNRLAAKKGGPQQPINITQAPKKSWKTYLALVAGIGLGATVHFALGPVGVLVNSLAGGLLKRFVDKRRKTLERQRLSGQATVTNVQNPPTGFKAKWLNFWTEERLRDLTWFLNGSIYTGMGLSIANSALQMFGINNLQGGWALNDTPLSEDFNNLIGKKTPQQPIVSGGGAGTQPGTGGQVGGNTTPTEFNLGDSIPDNVQLSEGYYTSFDPSTGVKPVSLIESISNAPGRTVGYVNTVGGEKMLGIVGSDGGDIAWIKESDILAQLAKNAGGKVL